MKAFALVAMMLVSSVSFASENSMSGEELQAMGFGMTIVGGGCDVIVTQNGENTDLYYPNPELCFTAPTHPQRYTQSVYGVVFATAEEAQLHCNRKDEVTGAYTLQGFAGYVCRELNDMPGGN